MTCTRLSVALFLLVSVTDALAADWSGDWRSFWRDGQALMRLVQEGDQVTGSYQPGDGRIDGSVRDGQLIARWREGDDEGSLNAALARDGRSFSGRFGNGEF